MDFNDERVRKKYHIVYGSKFEHQGLAELKKNYCINKETPLIGSGAFGQVYRTKSRTDESM